ncbi:uncharacterized protein LOC110718253 [Chenopodium quinoa]|uniref:uncharacterized protein LOC110718253 n=1 Tax=Chenopodium quinoa TaxID=63459 RepID=UPI000B793D45|nr:uncharacterized protein LOC110718253 [Chenopodium quinoa]
MDSSFPFCERICIPFQPMLVQITDCLDFPKPTYFVVDHVTCSSSVYVRTEGERGIFWFIGGKAASIDESQENAAQRAVHFLINKYNICVGNFTTDRMRMYELCGKLYRLKRNALESGNHKQSCSKKIVGDVIHLSIDYVGFMVKVVRKTGVLVTGVETMHSEGQGYISWVVVTCHHTKSGMECFFSELCSDSNKSQEMVTKKAIYYIMYQYNLDIVDANYGSANLKGVLCSLERESCLCLEERKKGQRHHGRLMPFLIEEAPSTPPKANLQTPVPIDAPVTPANLATKRPLGSPSTPDIGSNTPSVVRKRVRFS